jgi:lipocalin
MGRWIVQGHIPTYFDQNTVNNIDEYTWDEENQVIRISFIYSNPVIGNDGVTVAGPSKVIEQKAKIINSDNTEWSIEVKLVFSWSVPVARYLIIAINEEDESEEYNSCLLGLPDRSALWFMTRTKESVSEEVYQLYRTKAESLGYDVSKMVRVPYLE